MRSLEGLVCPKCHEPLAADPTGRALRCSRDGSKYPLIDGIPAFAPPDPPAEVLPGCALSLVIPALNEAVSLDLMLPQLKATLKSLKATHEIIVVDGGSSDGTQAVVRKHDVRLVTQQRGGFGGAYQAGFSQARGEFVMTLDADGSHDPAFLNDLWS